MKFRGVRSLTVLIAGMIAVFICVGEVSATPIGVLNIDSGSGGVTVGLTSIDWVPGAPGTGTFLVGGFSTLTSALGSPAIGSTGTLLDLSGGTVFPVVNFMTFTSVPGLAFDLATVGPGSANTVCAGLAVGGSCSVFAGSPIILTMTTTGTGVTMGVSGIARDGTTPSNWEGVFTTQLPGQSPAEVQAFFASNPTGTISSTYSGSFLATVAVPEPASLGLLGIGLLSLAAYRRIRA